MITHCEPNFSQARLLALKDVFVRETKKEQQSLFSVETKAHQKEKEETLSLSDNPFFPMSDEEASIVQSYPGNLHYLLKSLVKTSKMTPTASSYTQQELDSFRHNMKHLFVSIESYIEGWHPADLRTLWADGWREQDIIHFMMSRRVKYILCHNSKIISCLNLDCKTVYYFEKKPLP